MRGTDGVTGQFLGSPLAEIVQEVGGFHGSVEERRLPRGAFVNDACCDEMSQVVGLEVQSVAESLVLLRSRCRSHDGVVVTVLLFLLFLVQLGNDDGRVDVAVFALRLHHATDEPVHDPFQLRVLVDGIDGGHRLQPLVHVAVVERRSVVFALHFTRGDEEVVETFALLGLPGGPHALQGSLAQDVEAFAPEAACPVHGVDGCGGHHRVSAVLLRPCRAKWKEANDE